MTDIQKAARYFMLIKTSYGTKLATYGCVKKNVETYDKPNTLFYMDPPYYGTENYYKKVDFTKESHLKLKECVDNLNSKFILSYNDCEEIRDLYKAYNIIEVNRKNNLNSRYKDKPQNYNELIIKNY